MKDCVSDLTQKAGAPLSPQELKASFCDFCTQPECTRSLFGSSKFENRVSTWKERLFTDVPRMDSLDPRFKDISTKGFVIIPPEALLTKSSGGDWLDPREVKAVSVSVPEALVESEPEAPPAQAPESREQERPSAPLSRDVVLINTPVSKGIMLSGAPQKQASQPQRDAWDSPQPVRPGEKVVQRGATVRFGVEGNAPSKKPDEGNST